MSKKVFQRAILLSVLITLSLGSYQLVIAVQDSNAFASLKLFSQVFSMVKERYVDDIDAQKLVEGAIQGMLKDLDPHSEFLDVDRHSRMSERHKGEFFGVGHPDNGPRRRFDRHCPY